MGESFSPRTADFLHRATAILRSIDAGIHRISDLAEATAMPQTTIIRIASQLVDDRTLQVKQVKGGWELFIALRRYPLD